MKNNHSFHIDKMDILVSLYVFCIVAAELMGSKTFPILNNSWLKLNASVGIFLLPLIYTINDVIAEVHGKERARSIIRSGLITVVLVIILSIFFTSLPPSHRFADKESAYDTIFGQSARFAFASLTAFILAEFLDVFIFAKIREKYGKKAFWFRNNLSNFVAQFLDTLVFMTLAFYAFGKPFGDNAAFLTSLILPYWLLKCFMSVIETPFAYLGVKWLRSDEKS